MKRCMIVSLLLSFLNFPGFSQMTSEMNGAEFCSHKKSQALWLPEIPENIQSGPSHTFDALNYDIDIDLFNCFTAPYTHAFDATEILTFKVDSILNSIVLNADNTSLLIYSVDMAGVSFSHSGNLLNIQLNQTYNPGDTVSVGINYHHNDVADNSFYVSDGFVFTDCEPEGARKWFPCWDKPADKAKLDLTSKVPVNVKLGSNGALADSTIVSDSLWYHWVSEHNIATYLMVLTGRVNYNLDIVYWHKLSNPNDSIPIRFYYNPGENPDAMEEIIIPMTNWFSEKFCEHPFQKDGFATLNGDFTWGGMENQTLTSLCPNCWAEWLVAHEFAHQWWGDMITCGTWADIWLNEGFATWSEAFWYESYAGYDAYKASINANAQNYLAYNPGWAISNPQWAIVTPPNYILFNTQMSYYKSSCVLHMLRYTLGDSLFFEVLQTYANDPDLKYYSAVTSDLMQVVNDVTGDDYDWFFNQWIYEPNHPQYQNLYEFQDLGTGQWQVNFSTQQVQPDPEFFRMPMEVKIRFMDNSDTVVTVMNDVNNQYFSWIFDIRPIFFQFDPYNNIVLKQSTTVLGVPANKEVTTKVHLFQNIPNPVGPTTMIRYQLDEPMNVNLSLYNMVGERIQLLDEGQKSTGMHEFILDCNALSPGVYQYVMTVKGERMTRKLVIDR